MKSYNGYTPQQRNKAQRWLNVQWKNGQLDRPKKCCSCSQEDGIIDAHAEDYSEPFCEGKTDQFHLCYICHMMVHCRHKNPVAWGVYIKSLQSGKRFDAFMLRNWFVFKQTCLEGLFVGVSHEKAKTTPEVLIRISNGIY